MMMGGRQKRGSSGLTPPVSCGSSGGAITPEAATVRFAERMDLMEPFDRTERELRDLPELIEWLEPTDRKEDDRSTPRDAGGMDSRDRNEAERSIPLMTPVTGCAIAKLCPELLFIG